MARNMSFMLTTEQVRNQTKTVTRRQGWLFLKPGDILNACEKCQGLKKGEKINRLCQIRVTDIRREWLATITKGDVGREGFPNWSRERFMRMYKKLAGEKNRYNGALKVTRIEFEYIKKLPGRS